MTVDAAALVARLGEVQARVARASERAGRAPESVTLVAVSKNHPVDALRVMYDAGVRDFGESYVQEWLAKADALPDDIRWHLIGRLQSNKAKLIDARAHLVHAVDRASLLDALQRRADAPLDILLQVALGDEDSKAGVSPEGLATLLARARGCDKLRVRGLMTIPPPATHPGQNLAHFERLRALCEAHSAPELPLEVRSMGMTDDFEDAILAGATHLRVGTALFGART